MRTIGKILIGTLAALPLSSCTEKVTVEETSRAIEFRVSEDGMNPSKAMLDAAAFKTAGTTLHIEDIYTNGAMSGTYISSSVRCDGSNDAIWPFINNEHYYWTKTGSHRFFGWLQTDAYTNTVAQAAGGTAIPPTPTQQTIPTSWTYNPDTHTLSIPQHYTNLDYSWDFLYGKPYVRDISAGEGTAPVPLQMSHLYSAFALCFKNDSDDPITFTSVTLTGVHNQGQAFIVFTGTPTADGEDPSGTWNGNVGTYGFGKGGGVTYTLDENSHLTFSETQQHTSNGSATAPKYIDLCPSAGGNFNEQDNEIEDYHIVWPQPASCLNDAVLTLNYSVNETRSYEKYRVYATNQDSGKPKYVVSYFESRADGNYNKNANDDFVWAGIGQGAYVVNFRPYNQATDTELTIYVANGTESKTTTYNRVASIHLQTPNVQSWEPGSRYFYIISHISNDISLDVKVLKWEPHTGLDVTFGGVFDQTPGLKDQLGI